MNTREILARATEQLRAAGIESARLDARVLLAHVLGIEPSEILFHPPLEGGSKFAQQISGRGPASAVESDPSPKNPSEFSTLPQGEGRILAEFESLIARRVAREPIAYITGHKGFWDLDFEVGPGALVPRPETETLIEEIAREFPDKTVPLKILDLGTGSGCILLTLLHLYPNARGLGVDSSPEALGWARRNASRLDLESRAELRLADWDDLTETGFDIVASNPPYLSAAEMRALQPELAFEPNAALAGGEDGLSAYRALARVLPHLLAPSGCGVFEIGQGQGEAVSALFGGNGLEILRVAPDLSNIPRCVMVRAAQAALQKTLGNRGPNG